METKFSSIFEESWVQSGDSLLTGTGLILKRLLIHNTWRNGDHRYQVVWQPSDPMFIRLQVFEPNGSEVLNRLLS